MGISEVSFRQETFRSELLQSRWSTHFLGSEMPLDDLKCSLFEASKLDSTRTLTTKALLPPSRQREGLLKVF